MLRHEIKRSLACPLHFCDMGHQSSTPLFMLCRYRIQAENRVRLYLWDRTIWGVEIPAI